MFEPSSSSTPSPDESRTPFFSSPSLPKGGGTVSIGGGMLSAGGPDGAAGWQLPLPSPAGRALSAELTLQYSSGGGNGAFGAGWDCALPAVVRMTRFGFPKYDASDRLAGPSGEEILRAGAPRQASRLPLADTPGNYTVTPWQSRRGSAAERLEHWVEDAGDQPAGFWLHYPGDGSLSLYGWSPSARLQDPAQAGHVACWYLEETVSARGEHVVYRYRGEDAEGCSDDELAAHPVVTHVYPASVHAMNVTPSTALLIPQGAFEESDFLSFTLFDYGERGANPGTPPPLDPQKPWPLREDRFSFWRYGFNVRVRRLCRDVLLWHRTARMKGEGDDTPTLVARVHLDYDSSAVTSVLASAQQVTHETSSHMPPLEFELSRPGRNEPAWQALEELDGFWSPAWQLADLYGEGIPGLLYLDQGAWHYRAPQRRKGGEQDAITWGKPQPLRIQPDSTTGRLMDLDGDGRPEWLVTAGLCGSFTLAPDGTWGGLVPLSALPTEFDHPQALMTDLTGDSQQDVVLLRALGPKSVRLYPSNGTAGWLAALTNEGSEPLPSVEPSERQLVAFADPAGSGQAHLMRITGEGVTLWPSLGYGRFADAIAIPGFEVEDFNASRVFLADTDGAGTTDILYLQPDGIRVFVSQSGNRYQEGALIPAPHGVTLDATCFLQVADMLGQGTADLLLTSPHHGPGLRPCSWLYRFNEKRPWLLDTVVDNAGGRTQLAYRSSAQAWLDEKAAVIAATGKTPVSYLPFPVHTVSQITRYNDTTGLCLGSQTTYLGGIWDGKEREFAGFTRLLQTDTHALASKGAAHLSPPARTCSWFHSGIEAHDQFAQGAHTEAEHGFDPGAVRFTQWQAEGEQAFEPEPAERAWLFRALRGQLMRVEVYGEDGHERADRPYSVARPRLQVRACATADPQRPAALVTPVQALTVSCERISEDPQIKQDIVLRQDAYGTVLESVSIHYPRRLSPEALEAEERDRAIYPKSLPEGLITASCDPQQYDCWVNLTRTTVHNLVDDDSWVIGLPDTQRKDVVRLALSDEPAAGFTLEYLLENGLPLADPGKTTLAGYEKVVWRDADGSGVANMPSPQALVAYTRTAMLDKASLDVLRPTFEQTLQDLVEQALKAPDNHPEVLQRVRQRLPALDKDESLYPVLLAYLKTAPDDQAASGILREALKSVISVDALRLRLLYADPAHLPDGLQEAVYKQSRVADTALWAVLTWFASYEEEGSTDLALLHGKVDEALGRANASSVFWRAVLNALQPRVDDVQLPQANQAWLGAVQTLLNSRVQAESLAELLKRGGYVAMHRAPDAPELADPHDPEGIGTPGILGEPLVEEAYCGHHGISLYHGAAQFWLARTVQENTVTGPIQLEYTAHGLALRLVTDAAGLTTTVEAHDWRFLMPIQIKDANDNTSTVELDALGRVRHTRFYGTETPGGSDEAVMSGYTPEVPFDPPVSVEAAVALNLSKKVPVAQAFTVIADSWMPLALNADGSVDGTRRCGEMAWRRVARHLSRDGLAVPSIMDGRTPPHVIQIQTDRYDSDPEQQVRVKVVLNGGGQILQTAILNPPGEAFVRTEKGGLETDDKQQAVTRDTEVRWAVTGKTEFDNKGQAVRVWLPFYLDDWRWVSDDSAREGIYADTHYYDALGREYKVVCANGEDVEGEWANYERRVQVYPWFTVSEDENDTWAEVIELARARARRTLH
ncbi:SpvB/TcaC N-terminal domain-containing protein [Pseudomonas putida]|uniref:Toxin n=1 Tax=Pseudomonas putida TaxID=303 RepID=A0A6I6XZ90_PSEPU|nr:SpvB/TcaC N-terminal domain-containing protein [Pseudomonas putida]QHG64570.1 hypothetical protein C2H86_09155 [Pseudomonas putida]